MKIKCFKSIFKNNIFLCSIFLCAYISFSQDSISIDSAFDKNSKTFVAVPLITNNPTMGTGFGGLGMYFFKLKKDDEGSPPSLISLYGIYSTNNSYIIAPFGRFFGMKIKTEPLLALAL